MRSALLRRLACSACTLALAGCVSPHSIQALVTPGASALRQSSPPVSGVPTSLAAATYNPTLPDGPGPDVSKINPKKLAEEGVGYLAKGETDKAQRLFNAAIKFDGQNGEYHLLVGLTYHLQFLASGSEEARDNAFAGYQIAAKMAPRLVEPLIQTGRLYIDSKRYEGAAEAFANAVEMDPKEPRALYGLASASYLSGDFKTALWSAAQLDELKWNGKAVDRLRALTFAALGDDTQAQKYLAGYAAGSAENAPAVQELRLRVEQNARLLQTNEWLRKPETASAAGARSGSGKRKFELAALASSALAADPPPTPSAAGGASATPDAAGGPAAPPAPAIPPGGPVKQWYDCGPGSVPPPTPPSPTGPGSPGGSADETLALPALPSTCIGAPPPRMAVIDAVLLRTEDQVSRSYGLNLLQGLTGFFGYAASHAAGSATTILSQSSIYGVGGPSTGASTATPINYSLNIANATDNRNEVLARPALLAIDRLPSTFFSGNTVSIAVSGGAGSVSQLVDKQIGVSFSITPTFIDDDHVLLNVKAARSFVEPPAQGTSGVALSVSRQAVSASVAATFGETVVLSGLTERELIRSASGVPMLRDIPGVQYMFSSVTPTDYFRTIMIMITLRKPVNASDVNDIKAIEAEKKKTGTYKSKKYAFYWRVDDYDKFLNRYAPNLDSAMDNLQSNQLYKSFKGTDLEDVDWAAQSKWANFMHELKQSLFH